MKLRGTRDLSVAAVGKYGTLQEFSFFDKVGAAAVGGAQGSSRKVGLWWEEPGCGGVREVLMVGGAKRSLA